MGNHVAAHVQASGSSRAVVVDIVDRDTSHAELVEDALSACAVAIAVACYTLVDVVVVDVSIEHSLDTGLESEFWVVNLSSRLDELGHAHAEDVDRLLLGDHGGVFELFTGTFVECIWGSLRDLACKDTIQGAQMEEKLARC